MFKKFNWGWGIAIVYGSFVLTFLAFLAYTTTQKVDLVSEDYYNSELTYQSRMDAINRSKKIDEQIKFIVTDKSLTFNLPFETKDIKDGKIKLYRPSNSKLDKSYDLSKLITNQTQTQDSSNLDSSSDSKLKKNKINLDLNGFEKGMWKVQVEWTALDSLYYFEKTVFL